MCPFEELGCKFLHVLAKNCKFGQRCSKRLCPLRHFEKEVNTIHDTEIDMDEEQCNTIDADSVVDDYESFVTSTPQKTKYQCDECNNITQCTDCFVRQTLDAGKSNRKHKVHFKDG
jgi:hypothetical protein